jgi:hypothetical protein
MTDYRDAHNDYLRSQRQREYLDASESGSNSLFWLIGIAAVIIVGGLFLLSLGPSEDAAPVDTTAPMTGPADTSTPGGDAVTPMGVQPAPTAEPAAPSPAEPAPATPAPAQ